MAFTNVQHVKVRTSISAHLDNNGRYDPREFLRQESKQTMRPIRAQQKGRKRLVDRLNDVRKG